MPPSRRRDDGLLARVNFPLYTVQMLTSRHVLVAGGGGSSKTGVANGFEVFELMHNGKKFVAEEIIRHETGPSVVMNCAVFSDNKRSYIVAGQESHCQLYNVKTSLVDYEKFNKEEPFKSRSNSIDESNELRKRTRTKSENLTNNFDPKTDDSSIPAIARKKLWFTITPEDSVQTDKAKIEPCQRVVRISPNGQFIATGGIDGHVRVWNFPSMKLVVDINAHSKELDDIDFSFVNSRLISIAKDGKGVIWDCKSGKKVKELAWGQPNGCKYMYKRCRYGLVDTEKNKNLLFTLANPVGKSGKQKSYLQMWEPEKAELLKAAAIDESLSALAVRDDGRFVAIGTMFSGSISIYIAFSLQRVLHIPGVHSMFVTGLEFLPVRSKEPAITSKSEAAVVSISVDNRVCIHSLPFRSTMPAWVAILVIILALLATFLLLSYLGV